MRMPVDVIDWAFLAFGVLSFAYAVRRMAQLRGRERADRDAVFNERLRDWEEGDGE